MVAPSSGFWQAYLHPTVEGSTASPSKIKNVEQAILYDMKKEIGEKPSYESAIKYLVCRLAILEANVYKNNSVKFIGED